MVPLRVLILALLPVSASILGSDERGTVTPPSPAPQRAAAPPPRAVVAAAGGQAPETRAVAAADLEWAREFVARQYVVDGTASSLARVDPACRTECELRVYPGAGPGDFGTLKAVSGIDMGIFSMSGFGLDGMIGFRNQTADGTIANARAVLSYQDIEAARDKGEYAYLFYVQSRVAPQWQLDGDLANLDRWYREGLRILQLRYGDKEGAEPDERLAYGSYEGDDRGVTELGRRAIAEMNRLGMIVDVSHLSRQSTLDAAALSKKPVLASHANAAALTPQPRTKDDDELRAIAATGGVIGITPIGWMLDRDGDGKAGMEDRSPTSSTWWTSSGSITSECRRMRRLTAGIRIRGTTPTPNWPPSIAGSASRRSCTPAAGARRIWPSCSAATFCAFSGRSSPVTEAPCTGLRRAAAWHASCYIDRR